MNAGSQVLEDESPCEQETTDLNTLAEIFEPHINVSTCNSFKMSGVRYVWAIANFAHYVDPKDWFQLFCPSGMITIRTEDGTRQTKEAIKYLYHIHKNNMTEEFFEDKEHEGSTQSDLKSFLDQNNAGSKNSNWLANARVRLCTSPNQNSKYPLASLTANLLVSFYREENQ